MDAPKVVSFWQAINILVNKPHVVNKRLWGCNLLSKYTCQGADGEYKYEIESNDLYLSNTNEALGFMEELFLRTKLKPLNENNIVEGENRCVEIILLELLPKNYTDSHGFQLVCLKKDELIATFYDVTPKHYNQNLCPNFTYSFQLINEDIIMKACNDDNGKSQQWLQLKVLPQIIKWMDQDLVTRCNKSVNIKDSLALVPNDKYYITYNSLKLKYGKAMVEIWPESTDPTKFVFEDVAIATYLLLLWDNNHDNASKKPVTFVDIGCGNGLLVYILTKEGHKGLGVDVRKRKIWDMYDNIQLEEKTVTPENIEDFKAFDWIIGNHSDELTPWIPVMASRCSYDCNFFLLPCCAYNFDGTKYQRQNSSKSQYNEYLDYIYKLCEDCGFNTEIDRLKIPSTKRICLIGRTRKYDEDQYEAYKQIISEIINMGKAFDSPNNGSNFKARNPIEKVKNCTQIEKSIIETVVTNITKFLLDGCNFKDEWNPGREVLIGEVVDQISADTLKALKTECGGLQTLLKNNHHIFKVVKGKVQLRHPKSVEDIMKTIKMQRNKSSSVRIQIKPCWFFKNHPQGCPLSDSSCSFLHTIS
ncbi:PREDICTED: probable tRNA (uracil-O(2)-)-methyltransferase [Papilio polytes]|uniref:probable tRNA (uracil-O(2)-)-methyltransferase n=1 Tax=Papilio polytes TaxID=76194 RepID=UPI0006760302|nr:PREDICTED: probable tRNA (uracil-O(2)-)-methyltransferase [Papilio polytes]